MKLFMIKGITLLLGITSGVTISSKFNFLEDDTVDKLFSDDSDIEHDIEEPGNEIDNLTEDNIELINKSKYDNNLVLINKEYSGFIIDLKYATNNNITGNILYDKDLAYLQKNTLDKLIQANIELKSMGFTIKIWDAYRPLSVQKKLWAVYPDANFIANPFTTASNHNRGAAVDVTLVDLNGREVKMPTGFDEFGAKCRRDYLWDAESTKNVAILTEVMERHGFTSIESEWWHFDDIDAKKYSILDYKFKELLKK